MLLVVLGCTGGQLGTGETGVTTAPATLTSTPEGTCRNAYADCWVRDGRVLYSVAEFWWEHQWVEIWRDDEAFPQEFHPTDWIGGLELREAPPSPFATGPGWEWGVSTFYACDHDYDEQFDPAAWGDATVFWHVRYEDEHACWVAGKQHELGKAMGCLSLHDTPEECKLELP